MIGNDNQIKMYMHCARCLGDRPPTVSPADYSQLDIGWTDHGLQVWCRRHDCNVLHVDFEGVKHPASTSRKSDH